MQLVTVSSSDGEGAGWKASYLTDGNIEGGTRDRDGWSSISHSSPSAQEWAQVELGRTTSIGKVVLFSRSDLSLSSSTGFPSAFQIQCSNDGSTWTTLVNEVDYPGALAADLQIITFPSQSARYVRVLATELGGVAQESGYRMRLTEIEVYA